MPDTKNKETGSDKILLSFVTAWVCVISSVRNLIDSSAFRKVRFGSGVIEALCSPEEDNTDVKHLGMYTWISMIAKRHLVGHERVRLRMVLQCSEDGESIANTNKEQEFLPVEIYQLEIVRKETQGNMSISQTEIQDTTECMMRSIRLFCALLQSPPSRFEVKMEVHSSDQTVDDCASVNPDLASEKLVSSMNANELGKVQLQGLLISCKAFSNYVDN